MEKPSIELPPSLILPSIACLLERSRPNHDGSPSDQTRTANSNDPASLFQQRPTTAQGKYLPVHTDAFGSSVTPAPAGKQVERSNLVTWSGPDDSLNPKNLPTRRKWAIALATGLVTFTTSFGSSVFSATVYAAGDEFNASPEVMFLGLSLYVLGFGFGPLLWGPMSELYGRTKPMWLGMLGFCFFQVPWGLARNLEAIFICRFFAGVFGAAPLAILPGLYADAFHPVQRGTVSMLYYANVFTGPCLGPVVGAFVTQSVGWRWTAWITLIMAAVFTSVAILVVPETYEPLVLRWRAEELRHETKDWSLHAKSEEESISLDTLRRKYFTKSLRMISREPIVSCHFLFAARADLDS